jgi:transcriptional regulator with XRE-family HTH domain
MADADAKPKLGERLKELRLKKGLPLNDLAKSAGLSRSTLYKVENSGMSLTYEKLISLSKGLGVEISELFRAGTQTDEDAFTGRREVGRKGEGDLVATANYDHYYLCNEIVHKNLVPMFGRVKSRTLEQFGQLSVHPGEEFTYVLEGTIEVHTKLYRPVLLQQGDYIYLDSTMPHAYLSKGKGDALILTVCTSPEHQAVHTEAAEAAIPEIAAAPRRKIRAAR